MTQGDPIPPPPPSDPFGSPTGAPPPPTGSSNVPSYATPGSVGGGYPNAYAGPTPTQDDKTMGLLAHLLGIFLGFIGPLIIWLIKKDQSPFVDDQGKEALNFQLTILIAHVVMMPCMCIPFVNIAVALLHLGLRVFSVVFGIVAGLSSQKGETYRYPICLRMIK